jgi:hypothetical protein
VEYASHSTCIASPDAYLSFYESDETYQKMAQDVINMPHIKEYKSSMKRIIHFMSQMTLESVTIFTVCSLKLRNQGRSISDNNVGINIERTLQKKRPVTFPASRPTLLLR